MTDNDDTPVPPARARRTAADLADYQMERKQLVNLSLDVASVQREMAEHRAEVAEHRGILLDVLKRQDDLMASLERILALLTPPPNPLEP